jgi:hypothetical protein
MNNSSSYLLFLDLDGVLVDFDRGVKKLTGKLPSDLEPRQMWPRLARTLDFYDQLEWMPDGRTLWDFALPHSPIILTGLPMGSWAEPQKRNWCARELGEAVEVITCMSRQKAAKAAERITQAASGRQGPPVPVLVDDRLKLQAAWEEMGGVFIQHRSAEQSIGELCKLGFGD